MALSATKRKSQTYPEPYTVPPRSKTHRKSFIVLHGRGSNGEKFGADLLASIIPGFNNLQDAFPDAKFIFPTASKRRARIWGRTPIHQWFDNWSLQTPTKNEELQFEGLRESSRYIHDLLKQEVAAVGGENVVLWGLSQGMAISLIALLLWKGPRFAAVVGMCGWVPLKTRMESATRDVADELDDDDNPFDDAEKRSSDEAAGEEASGVVEHPRFRKAVRYLCEELQMPSDLEISIPREIPVFIGHGTEDEKVPTKLGKEGADFLKSLEFDVELRIYQRLGHWYCQEMLHDIVCFLQQKTDMKHTGGSVTEAGRSGN